MKWKEIVDLCRPMFGDDVSLLSEMDTDMWMDVGQRLTCREAEALIALLRALGLEAHADSLMVSHVQGDRASEDDAHYIEGVSDDRQDVRHLFR